MYGKPEGSKGLFLNWVVEVEAPTIRKAIEEGVTVLFYYYGINTQYFV